MVSRPEWFLPLFEKLRNNESFFKDPFLKGFFLRNQILDLLLEEVFFTLASLNCVFEIMEIKNQKV